jgi:hypothetical protein
MRNQSFYDKLTKGVSDALVDIREKVVEEGWFGRVVTERDRPPTHPETAIGFGGAVSITEWPQARDTQPEAGEHDRDNPADIDMDR